MAAKLDDCNGVVHFPHSVLCAKDLTLKEKNTYLYLLALAGESGLGGAAYDDLLSVATLSEKDIIASLRELSRKGYVRLFCEVREKDLHRARA